MSVDAYTPESLEKNADEIDLLDVLLILAQHIKLLIAGPILVGILCLVASFWLPKTFESISILDADKQGISVSPSVIANLATSANLLEAVAAELGLEKDASKASRIKTMTTLVHASQGRQDKLVTLRTLGRTPEQAQQLNAAIWKHLFAMTLPRGGELQRLQSMLKTEQARLAEGNELEQVTAQLLQKGRGTDNTARLYGELLTTNSERMRAIVKLQTQMEGLTEDDLVQTPTLPELAIKPKPTMITVMGAAITAMLLLLFVFARHALQNASQRPEQADKVARLRAMFRQRARTAV
jgi:Chain length determinant protein.